MTATRHPVIQADVENILADSNIDWHAFEGATILISGANGFLPAYMVETLMYANEALFTNQAKIIGLVREPAKAKKRFTHFADRADFELLEQDVADPVKVSGKVDYIIHAASQASPRYFFSDPVGTINANTLGTSNLLKLAQEKKVKGFLYFSSGEANGNIFDSRDVVSETDYGVVDPLAIRSCYAESKRMGENMCACYAHQYGVPTKIVRPAHTYGPGFSFDDGRAFTSFVAAVTKGQNIVLKSDGKACRSFIYLADATRAYFTVLLKGETANAYNVSNAYETSMLDLANIIIKASGNPVLKVEFDIPANSPSSANLHGLMSIAKIQKLGWSPGVAETEGFAKTLNYYKP